jgi:hypothetical protein
MDICAMFETIVNFDIILFAIMLSEASAFAWLSPLGALPTMSVKTQRIVRFFVPVVALAIPFELLLPPSTNPATIVKEQVGVVLTLGVCGSRAARISGHSSGMAPEAPVGACTTPTSQENSWHGVTRRLVGYC